MVTRTNAMLSVQSALFKRNSEFEARVDRSPKRNVKKKLIHTLKIRCAHLLSPKELDELVFPVLLSRMRGKKWCRTPIFEETLVRHVRRCLNVNC